MLTAERHWAGFAQPTILKVGFAAESPKSHPPGAGGWFRPNLQKFTGSISESHPRERVDASDPA